MQQTPIAFIGTGLMGAPMAQRLLGAGFSLTVWNRTRGKAEPLLAAGARWAESPADAVTGAAGVITMGGNGAAGGGGGVFSCADFRRARRAKTLRNNSTSH